jgi:hypothetical protein
LWQQAVPVNHHVIYDRPQNLIKILKAPLKNNRLALSANYFVKLITAKMAMMMLKKGK